MGELVELAGRPLRAGPALRRARDLWKSGDTVFLSHAMSRMQTRRISAQDVEYLITRSGRVIEAETNRPGPTDNWRYAIDGKDVDGRKLRAIVEMHGKLLIVTMIAPGR